METVQVVTKVERSPKGLVEALFNSLDGLNAGVKSADEVRAVAHTARSIVNVARLEMDAVRLAETLGKRVEFASLPGLGDRVKIESKCSGRESGDAAGSQWPTASHYLLCLRRAARLLVAVSIDVLPILPRMLFPLRIPVGVCQPQGSRS